MATASNKSAGGKDVDTFGNGKHLFARPDRQFLCCRS